MKKVMLFAAACLMLCSACTAINHNVKNEIDATNVNFITMKKGVDCKYLALGFIPLNNKGIDTAAKSAGIRRLRYVEYSTGYYLLFNKHCVVVYGD